jgi:hypothetical protein
MALKLKPLYALILLFVLATVFGGGIVAILHNSTILSLVFLSLLFSFASGMVLLGYMALRLMEKMKPLLSMFNLPG